MDKTLNPFVKGQVEDAVGLMDWISDVYLQTSLK